MPSTATNVMPVCPGPPSPFYTLNEALKGVLDYPYTRRFISGSEGHLRFGARTSSEPGSHTYSCIRPVRFKKVV